MQPVDVFFPRPKAGRPNLCEFVLPILAPRGMAHPTFPQISSALLPVLCVLGELCLEFFPSAHVSTGQFFLRANLASRHEGFTTAARPTASSIHRSLKLSP